MLVTESKLRQIIKEEYRKLVEGEDPEFPYHFSSQAEKDAERKRQFGIRQRSERAIGLVNKYPRLQEFGSIELGFKDENQDKEKLYRYIQEIRNFINNDKIIEEYLTAVDYKQTLKVFNEIKNQK